MKYLRPLFALFLSLALAWAPLSDAAMFSAGKFRASSTSGPTVYMYDTYTEASTISLVSHVPDTTTGGIGYSSASSTNVYGGTGYLASSSTSGAGTGYFVTSSAGNDWEIDADVSIATNAANNYVLLWMVDSAAGNNGYDVYLEHTGVVTLESRASAVGTSLGTYTIPSFTLGTVYTISLVVSGSSISAKVNGTTQISLTDATYATRPTLRLLLRNTTTQATRIYAATLTKLH